MTRLPDGFLTVPLAHRGLHGVAGPENSLEAFKAAIAAGYGIELDIQGTADGEAVVFHDDTLDRMTAETGPVQERALDAVRAMPLKGGGTIVDLATLIERVGGRVPLLVEVKDQSGTLGPTDGRLEAAVARAVRGATNVAVMSFNPASVAHLADLAPEVPRGLTTETFEAVDWAGASPETLRRLSTIPDYDAVGAQFISHNRRHLSDPRVAQLKAQGAAILCWTIRSPEEEEAARAVAQNITFEGYPASTRRA